MSRQRFWKQGSALFASPAGKKRGKGSVFASPTGGGAVRRRRQGGLSSLVPRNPRPARNPSSPARMQRRFICRCAAVCEFSRQARRGPGTHAQRPRRFSLPFHAEKEAPCGRVGRKRAKRRHSLDFKQRTQDERPPYRRCSATSLRGGGKGRGHLPEAVSGEKPRAAESRAAAGSGFLM